MSAEPYNPPYVWGSCFHQIRTQFIQGGASVQQGLSAAFAVARLGWHHAAADKRLSLKLMSFALVLTDELPLHKEHCCEAMTEQANLQYPGAKTALLGSTDKRIFWSPLFDEYGRICQPSAEVLVIAHCPFCGFQLPSSLRAEWFEKLEQTGWQTWDDPIPKEFFTEAWREL